MFFAKTLVSLGLFLFCVFVVVLFYIFFSGGHLLVTMHFLCVDASVQNVHCNVLL